MAQQQIIYLSMFIVTYGKNWAHAEFHVLAIIYLSIGHDTQTNL